MNSFPDHILNVPRDGSQNQVRLLLVRIKMDLLRTVIGWLKRRKVVVLLFVFSFIMSGLIVNLLELLTLPLLLINKGWFRILNAKLVYLHWCGK